MNKKNHDMHSNMDHKMTQNNSMSGKMSPGSSGHMMHTGMFKRRFFVCLLFTIPILLFSKTIQTWFQFTLTFPYQEYVLLLLSIIIYICLYVPIRIHNHIMMSERI